MKRAIPVLFICLLLMCSSGLLCFGEELINPENPSSLTLYYQYEGTVFQNLEIKTYRVAEVNTVGVYTLTGEFSNYPISLEGIKSQLEWRYIASTLAAYAIADGLEPYKRGITDENGSVKFSDILPGLYLTLSVSVKNGERVVIFENFMTVIPREDENGGYDYDGVAYPKYSSYVPEPQESEYKIVKHWKDSGYEENRPEYIEVDILKDGELWKTQRLSADNNWSYSWKAPDKKNNWTAVERNVPEGYTVSFVNEGYTLILTNIYESGEKPPVTGEILVVWPYILGMGISGGVITLLAFWRKRLEA